MQALLKGLIRKAANSPRISQTRAGMLAHTLLSTAYNHNKARWRKLPVEQGTVFYESFDGHGMLCNPEAIFRELLSRPEYGHLRHVWAISDKKQYASTVAEYQSDDRVSFVTYKSDGYYRHLATAQYLINNSSFPQEFSKRPGQIYVNTWHGIPIKKMGYDIPGGGPDTRNVNRNFIAADFLLSANPFMTNVMYRDAFKLRGAFKGRIIEEGYPRIDVLDNSGDTSSNLRAALRGRGVDVDHRDIVLYAPTWKGAAYNAVDDLDELKSLVENVKMKVDSTQVQVLLKVHQLIYRKATLDDELRRILVPNDVLTNDVLSMTDILVTDYSSLFFDFLQTERPIVFHAPDQESYSGNRGLYISSDEWPGPVTTDAAGLSDWINTFRLAAVEPGTDEFAARRSEWKARYLPRQDGNSRRRVVDIVFGGERGDRAVLAEEDDGREKLLIHVGSLTSNGITTAALNLLNHIDHNKFDVTVLYLHSHDPLRKEKAAQINEHVRQLPRVGGTALTWREVLHYRRFLSAGLDSKKVNHTVIDALFEDEWRRCMGELQFDRIIAFDGYSPFWAKLLLQGKAERHVIWAHNDLVLDANRTIGGKMPHKRNLQALFSLYHRFDKIVSVSKDLMEINERKLGRYAADSEFVTAKNVIDSNYVLARAAEPVPDMSTGFPDGSRVLVTVGRLSPEKNHERMLRALAIARTRDSTLRLMIIGGGPLLDYLQGLAAQLNIADSVYFAGQQANPYALMRNCDCFVFSSLYEGQGLVLIEAMILGLPIVTTEYNVVHSVIGPGQGLIVDATDFALADGLIAFARGEVPVADFDPEEYNKVALEEFTAAIS